MSEQIDPYHEPRPTGREANGGRTWQAPGARAGKCLLAIAAVRRAPRFANFTGRTLHRRRGANAGAQQRGRLRTSDLAAATGRRSPVSRERAGDGPNTVRGRICVLRCSFEHERRGVAAR